MGILANVSLQTCPPSAVPGFRDFLAAIAGEGGESQSSGRSCPESYVDGRLAVAGSPEQRDNKSRNGARLPSPSYIPRRHTLQGAPTNFPLLIPPLRDSHDQPEDGHCPHPRASLSDTAAGRMRPLPYSDTLRPIVGPRESLPWGGNLNRPESNHGRRSPMTQLDHMIKSPAFL
jgi:hypothetical protein